MKVNNEWEKEWEEIEVPKEQVFRLIEDTVHRADKVAVTITPKNKKRTNLAIGGGIILLAATLLFFVNQASRNQSTLNNQTMAPSEKSAAGISDSKRENNLEEQAGAQDISSENPDKQIVRTFQLEKETNKFEQSIKEIKGLIEKNQGYLENSTIENQQKNAGAKRLANFTIRVPKNNQKVFLQELEKTGVAVSEQETASDRTLEYTDLQSRLNALKTEEETLLKLMSDSKTIEDLLKVEERLAQVRGEKDSLEQQLLYLKNSVELVTVNLSLQEVTNYSQINQNISTWENIRNSLKQQWIFWKNFGQNSFVWLLSHLHYFLLLGIVSAFSWKVYQKRIKKE